MSRVNTGISDNDKLMVKPWFLNPNTRIYIPWPQSLCLKETECHDRVHLVSHDDDMVYNARCNEFLRTISRLACIDKGRGLMVTSKFVP